MKEMSFKNNPDVPDVIYKYRIWDDKYQKTILSERTVFMASPTSFEDKKDCKLLKRFDLMSEVDMYNKYIEESKKDNPERTRLQHRTFARRWTKKSPMKNKEYIKQLQEENFQEWAARFGVLSLTANCANLEMWNKYSDQGKGFCVGFNSSKLFPYLGGGGRVQYFEKLPDIYHDDNYEVEHGKQKFSKELKWEFEQEYRTHKFYPHPATTSERQIIVPTNSYNQVIFGYSMSRESKEEIKEMCKKQQLNVEFKQCILEGKEIKIKPVANTKNEVFKKRNN
jgi:uncharacterized short protein YbdD (DUF466 family)